jgi:hypothetical protein
VGDRRRLLIVLQAMDCGGKDGTVHHVVGQLNPQGLSVHGFGVPTPEERKHHFLWRIRRALPAPDTSGSSTARTTRTYWSRACTSWFRRTGGGSGTARSTSSSASSPPTG